MFLQQSDAHHLPFTGVEAQESKFAEDVEASGSKAAAEEAAEGVELKQATRKVYQASWGSQVGQEASEEKAVLLLRSSRRLV